MPAGSGFARVLAAGVVAIALLVAPSAGTAAAAPGARTLTASDVHPVRGERVRVKVNLPGTFRRPVRLQRKVGGRWVTIAKKRANRKVVARFSYRATAKTVRLRAVAPAVRHGGRRHAARRSRVLVIRPQRQSARLVLPSTVSEGARVLAAAVFSPARKGRAVVLQRHDGKAWRTIATSRQDRRGHAEAAFAARPGSYRVVARPHHGAPQVVSPVVRTTVSPRPAPTTPTPTTPTPTTPTPTTPTPTTPTPTTPEPDPVSAVGRVDIVTDDGLDVTSKENYSHATMTVTAADGTAQVLPTRLRVRGNSTSWVTIKRPYKVKLDTSTSVLGLPKSKDWVLLANFYDRSLLRNDVAFEAARRLGMPWVPQMSPVEVWLNEKYYGLYQLGEGIEVQDGRVELDEGGLLLEADPYDDDEPSFFTSRGLRVFLKSSEEQADLDRATERVQQIEDVLYSADFADPELGYAAHLDVDSFVDWYLLTELTKNFDSPFKASVWMALGGDGRLRMGPPWDFDASMGNRTFFDSASPRGWFVRQNFYDPLLPGWVPSQMTGPEGHWYVRLFEDPAFEAKVAERWKVVRSSLAGLAPYVNSRAADIQSAAEQTFTPRDEGGAGMPLGPTFLESAESDVFHGSWEAEAAAVESWLAARVAWLDEQYG